MFVKYKHPMPYHKFQSKGLAQFWDLFNTNPCSVCDKPAHHVCHFPVTTKHSFERPESVSLHQQTSSTPCRHCGKKNSHESHYLPHKYQKDFWGLTCASCGLDENSSIHSKPHGESFARQHACRIVNLPLDIVTHAFAFLRSVASPQGDDGNPLPDDAFLPALSSGLEFLSHSCSQGVKAANGEAVLAENFANLAGLPRVAENITAKFLVHATAAACCQKLLPSDFNDFKGGSLFEQHLVEAFKIFIGHENRLVQSFTTLGLQAPAITVDPHFLTRFCFSGMAQRIFANESDKLFGSNALSVVVVALRLVLLLGSKAKLETGNFADARYFIASLQNLGAAQNQHQRATFAHYLQGIVKDISGEQVERAVRSFTCAAIILPPVDATKSSHCIEILERFCSTFQPILGFLNKLPSVCTLVEDCNLSHRFPGFWIISLSTPYTIDTRKVLWEEVIRQLPKSTYGLGICDNAVDLAYVIWNADPDPTIRSLAFTLFNKDNGKIGSLPTPLTQSVFLFFARANNIENPHYANHHALILQKWTEATMKNKSANELKTLFALFDGIVKFAPASSDRAPLLLEEPCRILVHHNVAKDHLRVLLEHNFPSANGELAIFICKKFVEVAGRTPFPMNNLLQLLSNFANSLDVKMWNDFPEGRSDPDWITKAAAQVIPQGTRFDFKVQLQQWLVNPGFSYFPTNSLMYAAASDGTIRPTILCSLILRIFTAAIEQCHYLSPPQLEDSLKLAVACFKKDDTRRAAVLHFIDALVLELLQNRQGNNNTFLDRSGPATEVLSSTPKQVLGLPDNAPAPAELISVALNHVSANVDREINQVFPNGEIDPESITLEKVIRVESLLNAVTSQNTKLVENTKKVLIPAAKKEFQELKVECCSFTSELESLVSLFPTVRDFITNKNNLDSVVKDFDKTTLAVVTSVRDFLQQLRVDLDRENINFAVRCLNVKAKSQISSFFLSEKNPQTISSVDGAREALNDARTRSTHFFLTFTAQQIKNAVSQFPPGTFNLETELTLHDGTVRSMLDFDGKPILQRRPILQQYDILVECKSFAIGFKKLGCVNQEGAAAIGIVADSPVVDPDMVQALAPYANNAVFTRMLSLLDKHSAKIRGFLAAPEHKTHDPVERAKLFDKILEIQQKLDKSTEEECALLRMNNFVTAREFLFASLLDAHKISDDAAQRDVIADIGTSPTLLALVEWCDEHKNDPKHLRDVEKSVIDLEQNAEEVRHIFDQDALAQTKNALEQEKIKNQKLEEENHVLRENLAETQAILAKLQSPALSDTIRESFQHVCIVDTVSHDQLCSIEASVASHAEHLAQNPVTQVLTSSINQQSARISALREEVAKIRPDLAWAASSFPQVEGFLELDSQLLTNDNFNKASICDLERSIAHSNKLLPVVLGDNFSSLISSASFNGCVKDQNPQGIDTLSSCWLAIRVAELEMKIVAARRLTADEHFFGMLRYTQLEFLRHVQIDEATVKLDFFNQSCIAALASHHDRCRQEILHQEEEQHFMLNHDCVFDNIVIDEHFSSRILLSCALDSSFSSSVQEATSAHRVIMQEFELAQQRVQIEIDQRIARESSILDEERTIRQIFEDNHEVGSQILANEESSTIHSIHLEFHHGVRRITLTLAQRHQRETILQDEHAEICSIVEEIHCVLHGVILGAEAAEFGELVKLFTTATEELDKFNWFRLACHSLHLEFPVDFSKEKIIQMLETELLYKEEFVEVTDQTLRTCGFPGAIINRLRKVIDHLASASSFSSPAVQSLLDEVKSQLPGVWVLPPAEIGLRKSKENKLGAGGYGTVYTASIISQRNRRCAAKIFYDKNIAIQEARNLFHLDHPNVVRLLAVTVEDVPNPSVVLLFELADCDLKCFIKSRLPLRKVRGFISQIALGLDYLHQTDRANGKACVVHLDLKPANILVFRIGSSITLKISDLGFVHEMETSSTGHRTSFAATERYLSPETRIDRRKCRKNSKHNVRIFPAIDIFAFGIILLQMIAPTWYKRHGREQMQTKMDDVIHNEALLQSSECCIDDFKSEVGDCDDLVQLVKDCLLINRKIRPQSGAALLQRLSSAAQDFDVVNDSSDDSSSSSDDAHDESASDENDDEGGDHSTNNPNRQKRLRNTRSDYKRDGFPGTNSNNMPQTGQRQRRLDSAHQTLDDDDDDE